MRRILITRMAASSLARANTYMCKAGTQTDRRVRAENHLRAYRNYADHAIECNPKLAPDLRKIIHAIHEAEVAIYECKDAAALERVCADAEVVIYAAKCIIAPLILQK